MSKKEQSNAEVRNQINESIWRDEAGIEIPATRITKAEKDRERTAFKLYKKAIQLNQELDSFKQEISAACNKVFEDAMRSLKADGGKRISGKGNFTWYNLDRSIKVETNINEAIAFDDIVIAAAKEKLDSFIGNQLSDKEEFIRQLVADAFSTTKGKLDAKRVLSLLKYRSKIKAADFQESLDLIEKSIRRPDSRQYWRISYRIATGDYVLVNLNFSSI